MYKKTKKLLAMALVVSMILTQMLFTNVAFAATDNRIFGAGRIDTAVEISKAGWTTSDYAVLATAFGSADALAAAPLAKKYDAPILLTEKDALPAAVLAELQRLGVKNVFIAGGEGAVSKAVEDAVKAAVTTVERFAGADRVDTALKIAAKLGTPDTVVLVNGSDACFPDALSVSPIAAAKGWPILLVENKDTLADAVKTYIGSKKVYVVGGAGVVSDAVMTAVAGERVFGAGRYDTNVEVLKKFADDLDYSKVYVATGEDYPDALAGAALAAKFAAPIVLVGTSNVAATYAATQVTTSSVVKGLGGSAVVSDSAISAIVAPVPTTLKVESVSAINNKQIKITFTNTVDEDTAEEEDYYTIGSLAASAYTAYLQADEKSVIIDLNAAQAQQATIKVSVDKEAIKSADKSTYVAELKEEEIRFFDTNLPVFTSNEVKGPKTVRIYTNEPIQTLDASKIVVNDGTVGLLIGAGGTAVGQSADADKYYVDVVFVADMVNGKTYNVKFKEGAVKDYSSATGFANAEQVVSFTYNKVTAPVTVSVKEASQTEVKLVFSQNVDASKLSTDLFYHSVSSYKPASITPTTGFEDEYTLDFTNYPLPKGNVVIYVKDEDGTKKVVDAYGNKLASSLLQVSTTIVADETAPGVKEVKAESATQITIEFDETVNSADAQNRLNYTFKDSAGNVIDEAPFDTNGHPVSIPSYNNTTKIVTINLGSALDGGNYYVEVKNIRDKSLAENKQTGVTVAFAVEDETAPTLDSAEIYDDNDVIVAKFSKELDTVSATTLANYQLDINTPAGRKALPSGTTIALSADKKSVTITLGSTVTGLDSTGDKLYVSNIKDASGNSIAFGGNVTIDAATAPVVKVLDSKKGYFEQENVVVVYFDKELKSVDGSKIKYATSNAIAGVSFINESTTIDGVTAKSKVIVNLPEDTMTDTAGAGVTNIVFGVDSLTATNGKAIAGSAITVAMSDIEDKLAPSIATDADDKPEIETVDGDGDGKLDGVWITITEAIKTGDVSLTSFKVDGYTVTGVDTATAKVVKLTVTEKDNCDTDAVPSVIVNGVVRDVAGNTLTNTGTVATKDGAKPAYVSATVGADNKTIYLLFSEGVLNNTADAAALKVAVTVDKNTGSYVALGANDTVEIVGDQLIITLENTMTADSKFKVAADALIDGNDVVQDAAVETAALALN